MNRINSGALPELTFSNFVIGNCNKNVVNAAKLFAQNPSSDNLLFIYGAVGCGKTHLLHAIYNEIQSYNLSTKVLYVGIDEIEQKMINKFKEDKTSDFIEYFKGVDVLLIDDFDLIYRKEFTTKQFYTLLGNLYAKGYKIVLASGKPPVQIPDQESDTSTFLRNVSIIQIEEPDFDTVNKIIELYCDKKGIILSKADIDALLLKQCKDFRVLMSDINKSYIIKELCTG